MEPSAKEPSDAELLAQIARGDHEAFARLYDRLSGILFGLVLKIVGEPKMAEDVLQETFLQIWDKAKLFEIGLGNPLSWALTLARNKAIDHLRASHRRQRLMTEAENQVAIAAVLQPSSEASMHKHERAAVIRRALCELPMDQRQAIELAFFSGLTQTAIAETLQQPLGTIKARIRRGMLKLRAALEESL